MDWVGADAGDGRGLQSVDRLVRLLEVVADQPGTLTAVSARAGLSEPTALRYLNSMVGHGLVERDPLTRQFRVAARLYLLAKRALGGGDFMGRAIQSMQRLVDDIGETVNLGLRSGSDLIVVHAIESRHPIRMGAAIGEPDSWHASALGKAVLSTLEPAEARRILAGTELVAHTSHTITDPGALLAELARVARVGHAVDDEEFAEGMRCVAVPIRSDAGPAMYAMSISGPTTRVTPDVVAGHAQRLAAEVEQLRGLVRD